MTEISNTDYKIVLSDGTKIDINVLDQLENTKVKGSIWSQYNSVQKGGNNDNIFDKKEIEALKQDLIKNAKNGQITQESLNNIFGNNLVPSETAKLELQRLSFKNNFLKEIKLVEQNDATKVALPKVFEEDYSSPVTVDLLDKFFAKKKKPKDGKTAYIEEFKDYKPSNQQKYDKVYSYIEREIPKAESGKKADPARVKSIANMVYALSDRYGVDAEITAAILRKETGGYQFTDKVMVHGESKYKGVMQVDLTTIECMYANYNDWKTKGKQLTAHEYAVSYDHKHFASDDARIAELKKLYPTPEDLHLAIQKDVSLGVEVGIMAYKGKLSKHKGNTRKALAEYCGSQYRLPSDSTAVSRIWPLQKYQKA